MDLLNGTIEDFANGSLRTLFLCYKEVKTVPQEWDEVENNLVIMTMVGMLALALTFLPSLFLLLYKRSEQKMKETLQ